MSKLLIVESPNKIKKIKSFLNQEYDVSASCGHFRNLDPKDMSIDINKKEDGNYDFVPIYIVVSDKKSLVSQLKKQIKDCSMVYIATDYDREGEAIGWHLYDYFKIKKYERILFTEITKKAVLKAIEKPSKLDMNMFYSQQARMILDKLIGYKVSPLLWKEYNNWKLSAGRVQSVVVKILIEREEDIKKFKSENLFKITADFKVDKKTLSTTMEKDIKNKEEVDKFTTLIPIPITTLSKHTKFVINSIKTNNTTRKPSPPFITSSLQQEASNKFGYGPTITMRLAQKLYENGYITYMRTDSLALSEDAMKSIKETVIKKYGENYHNYKKYFSKSQSSQEAHEAIRPTKFDVETITSLTDKENKLYKLIYERTIESQMKPAELEITNIKVNIENPKTELDLSRYLFIGKFEKILFDGFLIVKKEKAKKGNDLKLLEKIKKNQELVLDEMDILEKNTKPKHSRFTEASLIKKLEELEIGRPSTYASMVSKVQNKGYAEKKTLPAVKKDFINIHFKYPESKKEEIKKISVNGEKNKIIPLPLGIMVNDYLQKHFNSLLDYQFTASVEKLLDEVAGGKKNWNFVVSDIYKTFIPTVEKILVTKKSKDIKSLGLHPKLNIEIIALNTRYGPAVCLNYKEKKDKVYCNFSGSIDKMTLDEAVQLLIYPKKLGKHKSKEVVVNKRKNYYLTYDKKNYSLDIYNNINKENQIEGESITLSDAILVIESVEKGKSDSKLNDIKISDEIVVKKGPYGFYIKYQNKVNVPFNAKLKKKYGTDYKELTLEECQELIEKKMKKTNK